MIIRACPEIPQAEETPFYPEAPTVLPNYMHWITVNYRESYNMFACNGVLLITSPRRGETFVTRKITRGIARIDSGLDKCLYMGNIDALRDWGHARDYVEMQWRMLQQDQPQDFVIATGRQESVRHFIELSAKAIGWGGIAWEGDGVNEVGRRLDTKEIVVKIDPKYYRPAEVQTLLGSPSLAKEKLGWVPTTSLEELVNEMVSADKIEAQKIKSMIDQGYSCVSSQERI